MVFLPVNLGRHALGLRVEDTFPEVNVPWLVAAILLGIEETVVVLQTTRTSYKSLQGLSLDMMVKINPKTLKMR